MKKEQRKGTKKTAKTALVLAMACMMGMSSLTGCGILKTDDKKPATSQTQQAKPGKEQKPAEQKPTGQKPTEQKPTEQKPAEQKPAEQKPAEQKPAEQKPAENQMEQKTEVNKEEVKEVTGKIESKKDSMVTVVDDKKAAYGFSFQEKPEGYDGIAVGDTVTVKYTGTVSDTEAFSGKVISITKQNSDEKKPADNKTENNKKEGNKKQENKKGGDKTKTKPSASTKK